MPRLLREGNVVVGEKGTYVVTSSEPMVGGEALGYFVEDEHGTPLFLKMFKEITAKSDHASDFVRRQHQLLKQLAPIENFVVRDIEFFERASTFYKVSERIEGETLQAHFEEDDRRRDPNFWPDARRRIDAMILARAISTIHAQGVAHLDLKPENCILATTTIEGGKTLAVIRLLDFDGALVDGAPGYENAKGTELYWSPEHTDLKFGTPGKPSDVFTLGIMLYQIRARVYPFSTPEGFKQREAPNPRRLNPQLSVEEAEIIWACIEPNANNRPSALEVHRALTRASAEELPLPESTTTTTTTRQPLPPPPSPITTDSSLTLRSGTNTLTSDARGSLNIRRAEMADFRDAEYISAAQARILRNAEGIWTITSFDHVKNPTWLNGDALLPNVRHALNHGDTIGIGPITLTVEITSTEHR